MIVEAVVIGEQTQLSLLNGISFAPLMALGGASVGAIIVRFIFRVPMGKKEFTLLYAGNLLATGLALTTLLVLVSIYPPQVIA